MSYNNAMDARKRSENEDDMKLEGNLFNSYIFIIIILVKIMFYNLNLFIYFFLLSKK